MTKATGASALFGILIDGKSPVYAVGHPSLGTPTDLVGIAPAPDGPVVTPGGAGNLTGAFLWRIGYGILDGAYTTPSPSSDANVTTPVGTPGLDDALFGGLYTPVGPAAVFDVEVDGLGTPDTFRRRRNNSAWNTLVPCDTVATALADGVTVEFGATTGHSMGDAWQRTMETVLSAQQVTIDIVENGSATVDRIAVERSNDGGVTWGVVGHLWMNANTPAWVENVAEEFVDYTHPLPLVSTIGTNYNFCFLEPHSFDIEPEFSNLPVVALKGTAGPPRSIPGPIRIVGTDKADIRPVDLFPFLIAGAGTPDSSSRLTDEPTVISVFNATTGKRTQRTFSAFSYVGSQTVDPQILYKLAVDELDLQFSGGKIDGIVPKLFGCNYGLSAPAVQSAGGGNWNGTFIALGQRYDPKAATDDVYIKITQALTNHTIKFKSKVGAAASYTGAEYTMYLDTTTDVQTKGGTQYNDEIELYDEAGLRLGADYGSNRQPYTLLATAAITANLNLNDEYQIPRTIAIPGLGTSPFSGVPPLFRYGPRFTDAHVTLYKNGTAIEATTGSVKTTFPKKQVTVLGAGARTLEDLPNEGFFAVEVMLTRFIDSAEYRQIIRKDDRISCLIQLEGERIPVNPGVLSAHREGLAILLPQLRLTTVKAPVTGQVLVVETITGEAEQPDNPANDLFTLTLKTRGGWIVPA